MNGPMCCGMPSHLNVISPRLQFYVCGECKQEVKEEEFNLPDLRGKFPRKTGQLIMNDDGQYEFIFDYDC